MTGFVIQGHIWRFAQVRIQYNVKCKLNTNSD